MAQEEILLDHDHEAFGNGCQLPVVDLARHNEVQAIAAHRKMVVIYLVKTFALGKKDNFKIFLVTMRVSGFNHLFHSLNTEQFIIVQLVLDLYLHTIGCRNILAT